jgi:hypothetical protein
MRPSQGRLYFAGYVQVYIPQSALILLGTNPSWRHILPESSNEYAPTSGHAAACIYDADDPPFVIRISPFLTSIRLPPRLLSVC